MARRLFAWIGLITVVLALASHAAAQSPRTDGHVQVPAVAPRPEDVGSIDGIVKAFYEVISGPAGAPRQWARDRTLYRPGVVFVALSAKGGKIEARSTTHQEFVDGSDAELVRGGFYETEIGRRVDRFGNIAQVLSAYEMRQSEKGPIIGRGVNSLQLYFDGTRWWIASAVWDDEREGNPIPADLIAPNTNRR